LIDAVRPANVAPAILIVEDHAVVRAALRDWLVALFPGYLVVEAQTGEEALLLAAAQHPRIVLVVMDIDLPQMNGIEATRQIKSIRPSARVAILTIHEEQHYQVEAQTAGADAYVFKREMQADLVPALKDLLARDAPDAVGYAAGSG
jgi:DNA-binding NarL/FixJ family response regulator